MFSFHYEREADVDTRRLQERYSTRCPVQRAVCGAGRYTVLSTADYLLCGLRPFSISSRNDVMTHLLSGIYSFVFRSQQGSFCDLGPCVSSFSEEPQCDLLGVEALYRSSSLFSTLFKGTSGRVVAPVFPYQGVSMYCGRVAAVCTLCTCCVRTHNVYTVCIHCTCVLWTYGHRVRNTLCVSIPCVYFTSYVM